MSRVEVLAAIVEQLQADAAKRPPEHHPSSWIRKGVPIWGTLLLIAIGGGVGFVTRPLLRTVGRSALVAIATLRAPAAPPTASSPGEPLSEVPDTQTKSVPSPSAAPMPPLSTAPPPSAAGPGGTPRRRADAGTAGASPSSTWALSDQAIQEVLRRQTSGAGNAAFGKDSSLGGGRSRK